MNNTNKETSLQKALAYLKDRITQNNWSAGERLPTYRALAQEAGVGQISMWKALAVLKKEKVISIKKNVGIYFWEIPCKSKPQPKTKTIKWQKVREQIKNDILGGPLHNLEFLPTCKELSSYYHAGFRIVKAAIGSLVDDGLLVNEKPKFRITIFKPVKSRKTLFLISSENIHSFLLFSSTKDWVNIFTKQLEKECINRSIFIQRYVYSKPGSLSVDSANVLGFIVVQRPYYFHDDHDLENDQKLFYDFLNHLLSYKKPITIVYTPEALHHYFIAHLPEFCTKHRIYLTHSGFNKKAGFEVGKFLIRKGHKKVCFFGWSPPRNRDFDRDRLEGLTEAFMQFNMPDAVTSLFYSDFIDKGTNVLLESAFISPCDMATKQTIDKKIVILDELDALLRNKETVLAETASRIIWHTIEVTNDVRFERDTIPLFRQALRDPAITAWVCMDDYMANYGARVFLKKEKIKIPEQIGLIGFQDIAESSFNGITSFRFDASDVATKSINLILFPKHSEGTIVKKGEFMFDLGGMVIDRGSV